MELGMIGLGRMGAAMVRRLLVAGHRRPRAGRVLLQQPRGGDFADKLLSAMRFAFGGHLEKKGGR